ncbi:MAG: hypothetical protein QOF79_2327 [Actinomycetota bacterium]|nr:hypothetical protein [Actinomycetota bacterium]
MRVETAWIWNHPEFRAAEIIRLAPNDRIRSGERGAVGGDAEHRHDSRMRPLDFDGELAGASDELVAREFIRSCGCLRNQARDSDSALKKVRTVLGLEPVGCVDHPVDDARTEERRVEPVASLAEVRLNRNRAKSGVDPDKQEAHIRPKQIGERPAAELLQLGLSKSHTCTLGHEPKSSRDNLRAEE